MKKIKGFTMIELLIVIAVLGILAIAVLSAINPIEQINRGRDTGSRSDSEQLLSAIERYDAAQTLWPWQDSTGDSASLAWGKVTPSYPTGTNCTMVQNLGKDETNPTCPGTDELKAAYIERITAENSNDLYIEYGGTPGDSVYICFNPRSGSFAKEADDRCGGTLPTDFPATACGSCPVDSLGGGANANCICLP